MERGAERDARSSERELSALLGVMVRQVEGHVAHGLPLGETIGVAPKPQQRWGDLNDRSYLLYRRSDATKAEKLNYSHIYIFDWVFSKHTLHACAEVLQRSPFYVMMSTRKPAEWWSYGLVKAQPVCKLSGFRTTGGEGMTLYVYINLEKVPQAAA